MQSSGSCPCSIRNFSSLAYQARRASLLLLCVVAQSVPHLLSVSQTSHRRAVQYRRSSVAAGPLLIGMRDSIEKRFSHARFQRLVSAKFAGTSGVSVSVKNVSVQSSRSEHQTRLGLTKTILRGSSEYQSRKLSGLVPSTLGSLLVMDVTVVTGSSMSIRDALLVPACLVWLSSSAQLGPVPRPPGVCRPVRRDPFLRSARSCAGSPDACRLGRRVSLSSSSSILCTIT